MESGRWPWITRMWAALVAAVACVMLLGVAGFTATAGAADADADAATTASGFYINGGGYGHGVGMSQYGALGFAQHGYSYRSILSHYYRDTTLAQVSPTRLITVLLKNGAASFSGADRFRSGGIVSVARPKARKGKARTGTHKQAPERLKLKPHTTYGVLSSEGQLKLVAGGREIGVVKPPLAVSGGGPLTLLGLGSYHGEFEFRPGPGGGVQTVNAVDIEDYVRGVIGAEMPSSWPMQALEAQAVAARTYAIAVAAAGPGFDVYSDTRSQVYGGIAAEAPSTDAAESATRGLVVDYAGRPATTYFFSSSGGYTESVQNVFLGVTPEAWLVGVPDPYDDSGGNPYYRWHETLSVGSAAHTLGPLVKGALEGIKVLQHGVSPRIVRAAVVGTGGTTDVSGPRLRKLFDLRSTYVSFTTIRTRSVTSTTPSAVPKAGGPKSGAPHSGTTTSGAPTTGAPTSGAPTTGAPKGGGSTTTVTTPGGHGPPTGGGGLGARVRHHRRFRHTLQGTAFPGVRGHSILAQRRVGGVWRRAGLARLTASGGYDIPVAARGLYRVVYRGVDGPAVSVR